MINPEILDEALIEAGWTTEEEIQELLYLSRQNENLNIKFKAIKYLRELRVEALKMAGEIVNASATEGQDGVRNLTFTGQLIKNTLDKKGITNASKEEGRSDSKGTDGEADSGDDEPDGRLGEARSGRAHGLYRPPESGSRDLFPGISTKTDLLKALDTPTSV